MDMERMLFSRQLCHRASIAKDAMALEINMCRLLAGRKRAGQTSGVDCESFTFRNGSSGRGLHAVPSGDGQFPAADFYGSV
jgi:hypothetical protein